MRLDDPARVIYNIFAFQALHLQDRVSVQSVIRSCWDAREQLQVLSQECVAGAWERTESYLVAADRLPVQKDTFSFKYPLIAFPQLCVLRLEEGGKLFKVENWCLRHGADVLVGLECVTRIELLEHL